MHLLCVHIKSKISIWLLLMARKLHALGYAEYCQFISRFSCPITSSVATRDYWKTPKEICVHTGDRMQTSVFLLCKSRDFVITNVKNLSQKFNTQNLAITFISSIVTVIASLQNLNIDIDIGSIFSANTDRMDMRHKYKKTESEMRCLLRSDKRRKNQKKLILFTMTSLECESFAN